MPRTTSAPPRAELPAPTLHRSGAVARMLRMPVATLRVWERRYGVTQARLSPTGQRLYTAADVQRLALMRQLVDLGHAIGALARLDMAALQAVAATHAQALMVSQDPRATVKQDQPPRRWDAAALADFAGLSTTVACECPRHVAEILLRLTQFEDYCAQCAHRSPADARLHAALGRVTARARVLFEQALLQVAAHEGLTLPAAPAVAGGPEGE